MAFGQKKLTDILGSFSKTIIDLETFSQSKSEENAKLTAEIVEKQESLAVNIAEINKATSVSENLKKIIGE